MDRSVLEKLRDCLKCDCHSVHCNHTDVIELAYEEGKKDGAKLATLRERMLFELYKRPQKPEQLFRSLGIEEREGRDILSNLIDSGMIRVKADWSLESRVVP